MKPTKMKKYIGIALAVALILGLSSFALAGSRSLTPDGVFEVCGTADNPIDLDVDCGNTAWMGTVVKSDPIEMWCSGPHIIPFDTVIVVHPWIWTWQKYTNWDYNIYKPGWYMTNTCYWKVKANILVRLTGGDFGHAVDPVSGNVVEIAMDITHYPNYDEISWFDVTAFNGMTYCIDPRDYPCNPGFKDWYIHGVKWYQRIHVGQEDVPGEYVAPTGTWTLTQCV